MSVQNRVAYIDHIEGEDVVLVGAPAPFNGSVLTRYEVSAVSISVYDPASATPTTALYTVTPAITADPPGASDDQCMFATLQEDDVWDGDGGYTFYYRIKDGAFHFDGGKRYVIEVTFTAGHPANMWPQLDDYGDLIRRYVVKVTGVEGV